MKQLVHVYVMLEDTFESRFLFRHCQRFEGTHHTYFQCPNEAPMYVLTRKCSAEYYVAASACCKVDEAIMFLVTSQPEVYRIMQFVLQGDDDTYWRVDQVQ